MYRFLFRPKWIAFHLLVLVMIVAMINLGFWQLRRLDQRREFNAEVRANEAAAVVPLPEVLPDGAQPTGDQLDALEWRRVTATGRFDATGELLVDQRSQDGLAGQVVLTPLVLDDGRVLLVERGFVPLAIGNQPVEVAPPPDDTVTVTGRLRASERRRAGGITDADTSDNVIPRVDIRALADELPGDVVPMFIEMTELPADQAGPYPELLAEPALSEGPHLGYAVQWFIFSTCAAVGWVLAVRRSIRTRRKAPATATATPVPAQR